MPSIIACWCTKCDDFQEDGRSCVACGTVLSILPLVDTMRNLEVCQTERAEKLHRVRVLKAEAAKLRETRLDLELEIIEYGKSAKDFCKSSQSLKPRSSAGDDTAQQDRTLRRFNRWGKRIAHQKNVVEAQEDTIRENMAEADEESRNVTLRLNFLRVRIRRIVQLFQTHFSGVCQEVLDGLPRRTCTEQGLECIFCTDDLNGETIVELPNCGHTMFHEGCVLRWLDRHNSCPVCRAKIQTTQVVELPL